MVLHLDLKWVCWTLMFLSKHLLYGPKVPKNKFELNWTSGFFAKHRHWISLDRSSSDLWCKYSFSNFAPGCFTFHSVQRAPPQFKNHVQFFHFSSTDNELTGYMDPLACEQEKGQIFFRLEHASSLEYRKNGNWGHSSMHELMRKLAREHCKHALSSEEEMRY